MDRRSSLRIDLQLTCMVRPGRALAVPVRTLTENISRTGVLMRWAEGTALPAIGQHLILDINLPENSEFGPRVMRCDASVVRVLRETATVALKVRKMSFVRPRGVRKPIDLAGMRPASEKVI